jgi:hypothetical protein
MEWSYKVDSQTWESDCGRFRINRVAMSRVWFFLEDLATGYCYDVDTVAEAKERAKALALEDADRIAEFTAGILDPNTPAIVDG